MSDRIVLRGMRFTGTHGVLPEEQVTPQPFEVDVILWTDLSRAAVSDDLADTTDYGPIFEVVRSAVEEERFALIERLAGAIVDGVLSAAPAVTKVEVRVRKPEAPLPGEFDTVEVRLRRPRPRSSV
ncbi:MAG TPA: dihydroneopterin aldolase [Candidatus Limnocylindria bacterium]|nr:dihydroneopterin aldolase [Candidatus Limnocylindria bacterium]